MTLIEAYGDPGGMAASQPARIGELLGLDSPTELDDVGLAARVAEGLLPASADALGRIVGMPFVLGSLIPEATLRRARKASKPLSREMSERLYEVSRVIDAAGRSFHGDSEAMTRFLERPHALLGGRSPLDMAQSSSAGADAVMNLIRRADAGVAL